MAVDEQKLRDLVEVYKNNLRNEFGPHVERSLQDERPEVASREYKEFREELQPTHVGLYEKLCNQSEKLLNIKADEKQSEEMQRSIDVCHLSVTPSGVISFSFLAPMLLILGGSFIFFVLFNSMFFVISFFIIGVVLIKPLGNVPAYLANLWRLKASNQMVLCIFYLVTYMRHTPNLENAIVFAGDHLSPPLSLDMKRLIWSVETEEYPSLKEALDAYLESWKQYNGEFVEAFHLIEASLYEGEEGRRLSTLDKALDVILEETYEKMLHYAHNLQSPITILHMLGVIMPILGLVILPLVVSFTESTKWYHIAFLYNVILPFIVFFMGKNILSKRPTGYGDTDISEDNPELQKYKKIIVHLGGKEILITPWLIGMTVFSILFLIGIVPLLFFYLGVPDFALLPGFFGEDQNSACGGKFCFLDYKEAQNGDIIGPFGLGSAILSLLIPISIGLLFGIYYRLKSKNVIEMRNRAKKLELEFAGALFQLGNRLGDNLPVEIAVEKVSTTMEGTVSGSFFNMVMVNQRQQGMGIEQAIFDKKHGALLQYPSALIESSMKVLTQSIKKGPLVAAQALTNVSRYIKEIHKVNERLRDIMADVISSMTSQIKFLAPAIAGVVIGITSMVTTILAKLGQQLTNVTENAGAGAAGGAPTGLLDIFGDGIPTYHFQIIVGVYVVQLVYILTILANGIENGTDKLNEEYQLGQNMIKSTLLYSMIAMFVMLTFNMIAGKILTVSL